MSKGSTPRPIPDRQAYEANWNRMNWNAREEAMSTVPEDQGSDSGSQEEA